MYQCLMVVSQNGRMRDAHGDTIPTANKPTNFTAKPNPKVLAGFEYVLDNLGKITILDARSKEEFDGKLVRAARGGHIPTFNQH